MNKLSRSHNWLIYRIIDPALEQRLAQYATGALIDIGCGDKPYLDMAAPYVAKHVGLDHKETVHDRTQTDLVGTAYQIPAQDHRFDTVLCTDVLEHLEEPGTALVEAYRVLKPGGYAIYTVPLIWHLHEEPRDFYRYHQTWVEAPFRESGVSHNRDCGAVRVCRNVFSGARLFPSFSGQANQSLMVDHSGFGDGNPDHGLFAQQD